MKLEDIQELCNKLSSAIQELYLELKMTQGQRDTSNRKIEELLDRIKELEDKGEQK